MFKVFLLAIIAPVSMIMFRFLPAPWYPLAWLPVMFLSGWIGWAQAEIDYK